MTALYELPLTGTDVEVAHPLAVTGQLPPALAGTLLRNGPGVLQVGGHGLNFFDGHGYIAGLTLAEGGAFLRTRNVPTAIFVADRAAGSPQQRMLFTNHPSRWKNLLALDVGNADNHDVYVWNGKVIATNDPGHHALDGRTLADRGPERWAGAAPAKHNMCPMPQVDPASGRLVVYTVKPGGLQPDELTFLELDDACQVVHRTPPVKLGGSPVVVHGHTFSERWYAVAELPARVSVPTALWGAKTLFDAFQVPPGGRVTLVLVERGGAGRSLRVALPAGAVAIFHLANASDDGDKLVIDGVAYDTPPDFGAIAPKALRERLGITGRSDASGPVLMRWVIDTRTGTVVESRTIGEGEAPVIDRRHAGQPTRYVFVCSPCLAGDEPAPGFVGYFHGVARLDTQGGPAVVWSAGAHKLCSPPAFVPRSADAPEGDGWMLTWVEDGATGHTEVVVLDTADVGRGPVATIPLGHHLPGVSHTRWVDGLDLRG